MSEGHRHGVISTLTLAASVGVLWALFSGIAAMYSNMQRWQRQADPEVRYKTTLPATKAHRFTRGETLQFLVAAHDAEDIQDPLQRCLKFPDPPGSHWNHAAVVAYCKYRTQPLISFAQAKQLIETGHAAKLDQMLAAALHAQQTDPDAAGRLDRAYLQDFEDASFDLRPLLDAWKRQSPNSAFAYAASGLAYEAMAFKARGDAWATETPDSNFEAMARLASQANIDLQRAVHLDPRVLPAYAAMISLGGATLGKRYATVAARRGLAVDPGDLMLYDRLLWLEEPKWDGSLQAMGKVEDEIWQKAKRYPLLALHLHAVDAYRIANCECPSRQALDGYAALTGDATGYGDLDRAGDAAWDVGDRNAQAIYYSEVLRFKPEYTADRVRRMYTLMYFHHPDWAKDEGDRILATTPDNAYALEARGLAYLALFDAAHAERDFAAAVKITPHDDWALARLGDAYAAQRKWDQAWAVADQLIKHDPKSAAGWLLRGEIQVAEPRPGAEQTLAYLDAHFGKDSQVALATATLRTQAKWYAAHPDRRHPQARVAHLTSG